MANFEILTSWINNDSNKRFPNVIILQIKAEYISRNNITTDDIVSTISSETGLEYETQFIIADFFPGKFASAINDRVKIMVTDNEIMALFKLTYS